MNDTKVRLANVQTSMLDVIISPVLSDPWNQQRMLKGRGKV